MKKTNSCYRSYNELRKLTEQEAATAHGKTYFSRATVKIGIFITFLYFVKNSSNKGLQPFDWTF